MNNALNPKITMMQYDVPNQLLCGRVRLDGRERSVMPFHFRVDASASDKEKALVKQAIKEYGNE